MNSTTNSLFTIRPTPAEWEELYSHHIESVNEIHQKAIFEYHKSLEEMIRKRSDIEYSKLTDFNDVKDNYDDRASTGSSSQDDNEETKEAVGYGQWPFSGYTGTKKKKKIPEEDDDDDVPKGSATTGGSSDYLPKKEELKPYYTLAENFIEVNKNVKKKSPCDVSFIWPPYDFPKLKIQNVENKNDGRFSVPYVIEKVDGMSGIIELGAIIQEDEDIYNMKSRFGATTKAQGHVGFKKTISPKGNSSEVTIKACVFGKGATVGRSRSHADVAAMHQLLLTITSSSFPSPIFEYKDVYNSIGEYGNPPVQKYYKNGKDWKATPKDNIEDLRGYLTEISTSFFINDTVDILASLNILTCVSYINRPYGQKLGSGVWAGADFEGDHFKIDPDPFQGYGEYPWSRGYNKVYGFSVEVCP